MNDEKYSLKLQINHLNDILHSSDKNFNIQNIIKDYQPLYEKEEQREKILKKAKTYKVLKKINLLEEDVNNYILKYYY